MVTETPAQYTCEVCKRKFLIKDEADECEKRCRRYRSTNWEGRKLKRVISAPLVARPGICDATTFTETTITAIGKRFPRSSCYEAKIIIFTGDAARISADYTFDPASVHGMESTEITEEEYDMYKQQALEKFEEIVKRVPPWT